MPKVLDSVLECLYASMNKKTDFVSKYSKNYKSETTPNV